MAIDVSGRQRERREPSVVGNPYTPGTWEYQFFAAHGRKPGDQDRRDREWSLQFLQSYGRPPSDADWRGRYGATQGGGGAVSGGEEDEEEVTMGVILDTLEMPGYRAMLPTYTRSWFDYMAELLRGNPEFAIPVPVLFGEGEEPVEGEEGEEEYAYMASSDQYTTAWQGFIDRLNTLSFSEQQSLQGWKYDPETGWTRTPAELLRHPEHL